MAPLLAKKAETSLSISASSPLLGSLGSAVPVVLMILLLLLCFPFKRKKRQLSTRVFKRERNTSQLVRMAKLEDERSPERNSLEGENMHRENALLRHQNKRQLNMNGVATELRDGNANSPKDQCMVIRNHQGIQKSPKLEVDQLRGLAPQTSRPPNTMTPNLVQFRKLPTTPKEAHISRMEPLIQSMDNQVYESIRLKETDLRPRDRLVRSKASDIQSGRSPKGARVPEPLTGSLGSGWMDSRTAEFTVPPVPPGTNLPLDQSPGQLQEAPSEMEAPPQPVFDAEKRLSALYARVCKRPKASPQPQPQPPNQDKTTEEEEEEPPPIPEKHFENLYESPCVETEAQGGEMPSTGMVSPAEV